MTRLADFVIQKLFRENPYTGFDYQKFPMDITGGGGSPFLTNKIRKISPTTIIEVGSWKGSSAIHAASLLKENRNDGVVICIDTWLGGLESLERMPGWDISPYRNQGFPALYYQFLANISYLGLQDFVVPFPCTSSAAARWLLKNHIQADLVLLDKSWDENELINDVQEYKPLIRPGGGILGEVLGGQIQKESIIH